MESYHEQIIRLATVREKYTQAQSSVANIQDAIDSHIPLELKHDMEVARQKLNALKDELAIAEHDAREACIERYGHTGDKSLSYGVKVILQREVIYDKAAAFQWAVEHSIALSLNEKAFEKLVLADPGIVTPDIAEVHEVPAVRIPTDLVDRVKREDI